MLSVTWAFGPSPCMKIACLILSPLFPTVTPAIFRAARNLLLLNGNYKIPCCALSKVIRAPCHSEERSDEESAFARRIEEADSSHACGIGMTGRGDFHVHWWTEGPCNTRDDMIEGLFKQLARPPWLLWLDLTGVDPSPLKCRLQGYGAAGLDQRLRILILLSVRVVAAGASDLCQ